MFALFRMQSTLLVWQTRFCDGAYETCERFRRSEKCEDVAPNLLPNGTMLPMPAGGGSKG